MVRQWRRKGPRATEALFLGLPTLILVLFYLGYTTHYGGVCVGIRWLLPCMPILFLFCADWIDENSSLPRLAIFGVLLLIGIVHALDSLNGPWRESAWAILWGAGAPRG